MANNRKKTTRVLDALTIDVERRYPPGDPREALRFRPPPGPETVRSAATNRTMEHYEHLDHIHVRVDDGISTTYKMSALAYHNVLMSYVIRMANAEVYRYPVKANFAHIDIRKGSPTAIQHFHEFCRIFSTKRGNFDFHDLIDQCDIIEQESNAAHRATLPRDPRFVSIPLHYKSNRYFLPKHQRPCPIDGSLPDFSTVFAPGDYASNHAIEHSRPPGVRTLPDGDRPLAFRHCQPVKFNLYGPLSDQPPQAPSSSTASSASPHQKEEIQIIERHVPMKSATSPPRRLSDTNPKAVSPCRLQALLETARPPCPLPNPANSRKRKGSDKRKQVNPKRKSPDDEAPEEESRE